MASDKVGNRKFTYGDSVSLVETAPPKYSLDKGIGSVCAITLIDNDLLSSTYQEDIGAYVYLIEGPDGKSVEVPERYLSKIVT